MAFETATITSNGYSILAQLTATKTLCLKHIFVDVSEHTAEDFAKPISYWQGVQDTRVNSVFASVGADGNKSRIVLGMKIKPQYSDLTVTVKSIAVSACTLENGTEGAESIIYGLSDSHGIDVIANPSVSITSNVALDIIIDPASSITVEGGTNPNYALQSDLSRFVSCHKAGDPTTGQTQIIRGDKAFDNNVTFGGGFQVEGGSSARIDTVDGSYLGFYEDGSQFAFIGYEINDGGLVITGRESGANNCESLIFGYIDDFGDAPNDPSYFMKMLTNLDGGEKAAIQVCADCVIPYTTDGNTRELGTANYKWASVWTNNLFTTTFKLNDAGTQYVDFDGEMLTFKLNPAANADPMMSISYVDGLYCSKPICSQYARTSGTSELKLRNGNMIDFWSNVGGETAGYINFFRDDNGALGIQFYDTMYDEEICAFNFDKCRFTGPVEVSTLKCASNLILPIPDSSTGTPCGVPFFIQYQTSSGAIALSRGYVIKPHLNGSTPDGYWNIYNAGGSLLASNITLTFCTISGQGIEGFSSTGFDADAKFIVLSPILAAISPFMVIRVQ